MHKSSIIIMRQITGWALGYTFLSVPPPTSSGIDEVIKIVVSGAMVLLSQIILDAWKERKASKAKIKTDTDENLSA